MMATLTVVTLTQDGGSSPVDPVDDAVAVANTTTGDKFYNGTDRRTILIVHNNASNGHDMAPQFWTKRYFGGDDQGSWPGMIAGVRTRPTPASAASTAYEFGGLISNGDTKIFGPFPSYWFNDAEGLVQFTIYDETTGLLTDASGVTVLPVYVPNVNAALNVTYRQQS